MRTSILLRQSDLYPVCRILSFFTGPFSHWRSATVIDALLTIHISISIQSHKYCTLKYLYYIQLGSWGHATRSFCYTALFFFTRSIFELIKWEPVLLCVSTTPTHQAVLPGPPFIQMHFADIYIYWCIAIYKLSATMYNVYNQWGQPLSRYHSCGDLYLMLQRLQQHTVHGSEIVHYPTVVIQSNGRKENN